jgi:hypothetical protein
MDSLDPQTPRDASHTERTTLASESFFHGRASLTEQSRRCDTNGIDTRAYQSQYINLGNVCPVLRTIRLLRAAGNYGELKGVGISFVKDFRSGAYGPYIITQTLPNSPAEICGHIHTGDLLFSVNGTNVHDKDATQVTALILGEPGTPVVLAIASRQQQQLLDESVGNDSLFSIHEVNSRNLPPTTLSVSMWQVQAPIPTPHHQTTYMGCIFV